jgi:hypothetical protein
MKSTAITAPLLLLGYGVLRWFDGRDGHHDKTGFTWRAGHVLFFLAMVLFAVIAVRLGAGTTLGRLAAVVAVAGVLSFLWVITGDLFPSFPDLPGPLSAAGPLLFVLGTAVLLFRRLPWWSPALFLAGFIAISVNLDLLPAAALLILGAFAPLARASDLSIAANRH